MSRIVSIHNPILKNEIFGPILPIIKYDDFDTVLDFINRGDKALALYFFSKSKQKINQFLEGLDSATKELLLGKSALILH